MAHADVSWTDGPKVVGSFGGPDELLSARAGELRESCDLAEIRLDLLVVAGGRANPGAWSHLDGIPLLFTARRRDEGGALELSAAGRMALLEQALGQAALVDIEVASLPEMPGFPDKLGVPWIASFHDFERLPETPVLEAAAKRARDAGAAAFKVAARLHGPADLARLAEFQLADQGIPVSSMGMGPLAPVSRLLCAQCGSVLNYGFLGRIPTAPGQWDAASLKQAIARLAPFRI